METMRFSWSARSMPGISVWPVATDAMTQPLHSMAQHSSDSHEQTCNITSAKQSATSAASLSRPADVRAPLQRHLQGPNVHCRAVWVILLAGPHVFAHVNEHLWRTVPASDSVAAAINLHGLGKACKPKVLQRRKVDEGKATLEACGSLGKRLPT